MQYRLKRHIFGGTIISILILVSAIIGCSKPPSLSSTSGLRNFETDKASQALCIDLSNDRAPTAGIFLSLSPSQKIIQKNIILPFESDRIEFIRPLINSWGSFKGTTLINYYITDKTNGNYFIPILFKLKEFNEAYPDVFGYNESIAIHKLGLERHFIYKYPETDPNLTSWQTEFSSIATTSIDKIGIRLPINAKGREIRQTGLTSIPQHEFSNGSSKFYPATSSKKYLEISYEIPPTSGQKIALSIFSAFFIALLVPGIQLLILSSRQKNSSKSQKWIIRVGIFIEILILSAIIFLSVKTWDFSTITSIGYLIASVIGGAGAGYVYYKEKE